MTRVVHQLVHTLSYGDAISGEVLALQRCFSDFGWQSEIFAIHVHPKLKGRAQHYTDFPKDFSGEVILHYSLGSPLNSLYSELSTADRSLIFHNLTPAKWFRGIHPRIVSDIVRGQEELPALLEISDRIIADSAFNASELAELGHSAVELELPIDPERWNLESNEGISNIVRSQGGIHLLHVGRLAPNKCIEDIIRTFYFLHHHIDENSKLWLVGIDIDTELYSFSLKHLVLELGLEDAVEFVGCLADSELKALYESCDVYVCMSEHEGFCLPVIEAMNFGLPVVAFACAALPDTVGDGGILVSRKHPAELSELLYRVATDSELRDRMVQAGKKRIASLSFDRFEAEVRELFTQSNLLRKQACLP